MNAPFREFETADGRKQLAAINPDLVRAAYNRAKTERLIEALYAFFLCLRVAPNVLTEDTLTVILNKFEAARSLEEIKEEIISFGKEMDHKRGKLPITLFGNEVKRNPDRLWKDLTGPLGYKLFYVLFDDTVNHDFDEQPLPSVNSLSQKLFGSFDNNGNVPTKNLVAAFEALGLTRLHKNGDHQSATVTVSLTPEAIILATELRSFASKVTADFTARAEELEMKTAENERKAFSMKQIVGMFRVAIFAAAFTFGLQLERTNASEVHVAKVFLSLPTASAVSSEFTTNWLRDDGNFAAWTGTLASAQGAGMAIGGTKPLLLTGAQMMAGSEYASLGAAEAKLVDTIGTDFSWTGKFASAQGAGMAIGGTKPLLLTGAQMMAGSEYASLGAAEAKLVDTIGTDFSWTGKFASAQGAGMAIGGTKPLLLTGAQMMAGSEYASLGAAEAKLVNTFSTD